VGWENDFQTIITIPTGATTGARIVIDGITGTITVYDSAGNPVDIIGGPTGSIISQNDAQTLFTELLAGQALFGPLPLTGEAARITYFLATIGAFTVPELILRSPVGTFEQPGRNPLIMTMIPGGDVTNPGGGVAVTPMIQLLDGDGLSAADVSLSGAIYKTDDVGNPLVWQTVANGGIVLGSGWATDSNVPGAQKLQYRIDAEDNLVITGVCHTTSATPSTTLFTVVAPYVPLHLQRCTVETSVSGVQTLGRVSISSVTGNVDLTPALTASGVDLYCNITVPLGNLP